MQAVVKAIFLLALGLAVQGFFISSRMQIGSRPTQTLSDAKTGSVEAFKNSPVSERNFQEALKYLEEEDADDDEDEEDYEDEDFEELYEDSLDFEVDEELLAQIKSNEANRLANRGKSQEEINNEKITNAIAKWRKHDNDVGSAAVQVAISHERVLYLTQHMLRNRKDNSAKRGLQQVVNERRKMLDYLYQTDRDTAQRLVTELGIRYRAPGRFWDKQIKYGRFKNTKQIVHIAKQSKPQSEQKQEVVVVK